MANKAEEIYGGLLIPVTLTSYCPFQSGLTPKQRLMEGGGKDRKGNRLHTLDDHISDPLNHPYVSLACDYTLFTYGQRVIIPAIGEPSNEWKAITGWDQYQLGLVDTGGHFFGSKKVYRNEGHEPIDVCVNVCGKQPFRGLQTDFMTIVPGENVIGVKATLSSTVAADVIDVVGETLGADTEKLDDFEKTILMLGIGLGITGILIKVFA